MVDHESCGSARQIIEAVMQVEPPVVLLPRSQILHVISPLVVWYTANDDHKGNTSSVVRTLGAPIQLPVHLLLMMEACSPHPHQ